MCGVVALYSSRQTDRQTDEGGREAIRPPTTTPTNVHTSQAASLPPLCTVCLSVSLSVWCVQRVGQQRMTE